MQNAATERAQNREGCGTERHFGEMPHVVMRARFGDTPAFVVCAPTRRSVATAAPQRASTTQPEELQILSF